MTPSQSEAYQRHKRFHDEIAYRATLVYQPEERTYSIPNKPFGVAKIPDLVIKEPPNIEPLYWHCMWFADLIAIRQPRPPGPPTIDLIQRTVARHYGVTKHDMLSERRTANVVLPRQIAMYLCKRLTPRSLPEVGRRFGGRDHTTVLHGIRKITARCVWDSEFAGKIEAIASELRA